jgi:hypothetical protein
MNDPSISPGTAMRARPSRANGRTRGGERVRLAKIVTPFGSGGTERQFINLGLALDAQRFAPEYACLGGGGICSPNSPPARCH